MTSHARLRPSWRALILSLAAATLTAGAARAADRWTPIPALEAASLPAYCGDALAALRQRVRGLEALPVGGAAAPAFAQINALQVALEDLEGPVYLLNNVSPDPALRKAAEACVVEIGKFSTELFQNEALYRLIRSVKPADAIETKLQRDLSDGFEDSGVALPPEKRARMKAIVEELDSLELSFARNVRDNDTRLKFTADELKGLPADYIARAKRDADGNYLLGFGYPEYIPFMEYAESESARRRYQFAFVNRGTPRNLDLLSRAIALRAEIAGLFGYPSFADFQVRNRMAADTKTIDGFLDGVRAAVRGPEQSDLEELRAFIRTQHADVALQPWNLGYWQRRLKQQRYQLDQNALRRYFPTEASVAWVIDLASRLYGIEFKPVKPAVWHEDVRVYDVVDRGDGQVLGGVYLDLFPRDGKYGHAAAFGVRRSSTLAGRKPVTALVANLNRAGLDGEELVTLLHEFGHVLHGVLSSTRYVSQGGTSVERDFVEAPSQMFEEWGRHLEPLRLLAAHCSPACPQVDADLVRRMTAAHNFGRGLRYGRQLLYAGYDMTLHEGGPQARSPLALWVRMESDTPLGHVRGTEFPGQFGHIMGGYAAGYYGYLWSEVIALDMLSAFGDNLLDPAVGARYRQAILARGGERRASELVRAFLGRAPSNRAFFDEIAGKRLH